jgi:hypothetical protein
VSCAHCGANATVMIPMAPGFDKKPWQLCSRCWLDGARSEKLGNIPKRYTEKPDEPFLG